MTLRHVFAEIARRANVLKNREACLYLSKENVVCSFVE